MANLKSKIKRNKDVTHLSRSGHIDFGFSEAQFPKQKIGSEAKVKKMKNIF